MRAIQKLAAAGAILAAPLCARAAEAVWLETPMPGEMMQAYPGAADRSQDGLARIKCLAQADGRLDGCVVQSESPEGQGFGEAALKVAKAFRMRRSARKQYAPGIVLPLRFEPQPAGPPWREAAFQTAGDYRYFGPPGPYFPDRAARGEVRGEVVTDCRVGADNRLSDCKLVSVWPATYGFEFAVGRMIGDGWMTAGPAPDDVPPPADGVWRFRVPFSDSRAGYSH